MSEPRMSQKKPSYPISNLLEDYLNRYNRYMKIPISYEDLERFSGSVSVYNQKEEDTLWIRVFYAEHERSEIDMNLKKVYTLFHSDGSEAPLPYLNVDAIDYCTFGNSKPFRIKIRNILNDNFVYFYVKKADASRIYGLALEHMLSPDNLNFLVYKNTLIEEHIAGIPGDEFIQHFLPKCLESEKAQITKEFVKFNERCMIRLLGDMRAYNYVIVPTHDFDQVIYKIRAIDFDQQSFESNLKIYRPQFFKENYKMVELVKNKLNKASINQYKIEERSIIAKRLISSGDRIKRLMNAMISDHLAPPKNIDILKNQVYQLTLDRNFLACNTMGQIVQAGFDFVKRNYESHEALGIH